MRSDMDHTVLPANYTMPAFTPSRRASPPFGWYSFTVPRRVEGWVDLGGWLHTEIKCRLQESNPDTVTHPSTNRAQRRLTSLIETNDVTTTPRLCLFKNTHRPANRPCRFKSASGYYADLNWCSFPPPPWPSGGWRNSKTLARRV